MDWVLPLRSDALTFFFRSVTRLGDAAVLGTLLALGYWVVSRRRFADLARLVLATTVLNVALKEWFRVPRPDVPHLVEESGWSFPSGHAQITAALAVWLALESRRPGVAAGLALLALLVAASRVYLGVHTPLDVSAGALLGAAFAAAAWRLAHPPRPQWTRLGESGRALLLVLLAVSTRALPGGDRPELPGLAALLAGFWSGEGLRTRLLPDPEPRGALRVALAAAAVLPALVLMVAVLLRLRAGLAQPLGAQILLGVTGLLVTLGVPALFRGLRLTRPRPGASG